MDSGPTSTGIRAGSTRGTNHPEFRRFLAGWACQLSVLQPSFGWGGIECFDLASTAIERPLVGI